MKTKPNPKVTSEVRRLQARLDSIEATERFMIRVRRDVLKKAERLRKLAVAAARARKRGHNEIRAAELLDEFALSLQPFYKAVKMTKRERAAHDKIMRRGR